MNNKLSALWAVLGSIAIVLVFRIAGWIDNSWFGFGIAGAVFGVVLLQKIPETKLTVFTKVYLVWLLWVAGLPMIQSSLTNSAPITAEAMGDRRIYEDLRGAELTRPQMLDALLGYSRAINGIDNEVGLRIAQRCNDLRSHSSRMSLSELQQATEQIGQEIDGYKRWRSDAGKPITEEYRKSGDLLQGSPPRRLFWALGLMFAIAGVLLPATDHPKASKAVWGLAAVMAVLFIFDRIIWGGAISITQSIASVQNASAKTLYFVIGLGVITIIALGHAFNKKGLGWVVGLLLVLLFVGYQAFVSDSGGKIGARFSTSGASASTLDGARSGNAQTVTEYYANDRWTKVDLSNMPIQRLRWDSSTDIQLKLADGRIISAPKDQNVKLGRIPGSSVLVRGPAGKIVFTVM